MSGLDALDRPAPRPAAEALRALRRFEPGRPAYAKGLRAGLILGGALAIGVATGHLLGGILAALGGLNCVMADGSDVALRRRLAGLSVAVLANAGALTLGSVVGVHLWSALVLLGPVALLAGLAGTLGPQAASVGLTSSVDFMVGLGLAGSAPAAATTFLVSLAGGVGAMVVLVVRLPPDPLGPPRRAVAGALESVAGVYAALGSGLGPGPGAEPAASSGTGLLVGRVRLARQRLAAARQVLATTRPPGRRAGPSPPGVGGSGGLSGRSAELLQLGTLVELASALVVRSESVAVLHDLLEREPEGQGGFSALAGAAGALAGWLGILAGRLRASGGRLRASDGRVELPGSEQLGGALRALAAEADRLRALPTTSESETVRDAVAPLTLIRPAQEQWRGILELLRSPPGTARTSEVRPATWAGRLDRVWRNLSPASSVGRRSLQFAVTAVVGYTLGQQLGLDKAYWVTLTIAVILQPAAAPSLERAFLRVSGTLAGSLVGAVLLGAVHNQDVLIALIAVLGAVTFALMRINYALAVTFLTPLVLMVVSLPHPGDWPLALTRFEATVLGAALVVVSGLLLWPGAARVRTIRQAAAALLAERRYLEVAWTALGGHQPATARRLVACRREAALLADNAEADLDRWLGDLPRHPEQLGLLWSLTTAARSVHLEVSAIAERALERDRHQVPESLDRAAQAVGDELEGLAGALAALPARPTGAALSPEPPRPGGAGDPALAAAHREVERLEGIRARQLLAGAPVPPPAAPGVSELRVLELALEGIGESLVRVRADLAHLQQG